jgi:tRNA threonylcarbamoyl adenosine modification protein YeaZ
MKILALEFSSAQRSVALVERAAGPQSWIEHETVETGTGLSKPFQMIEQVLRQAGIEREQIRCLAVGLGPGSYTGIRLAIAVAQGWHLAREVNLHGLSSADCLAAQAHVQGLRGRIAIIIDAQRGEFYLAVYELNSTDWSELERLRLVSREVVVKHSEAGDVLVGPEVSQWFPQGRTIFPRAAILGKLAFDRKAYIEGEKLEPIYLRKTSFVKAPPPRVLPE